MGKKCSPLSGALALALLRESMTLEKSSNFSESRVPSLAGRHRGICPAPAHGTIGSEDWDCTPFIIAPPGPDMIPCTSRQVTKRLSKGREKETSGATKPDDLSWAPRPKYVGRREPIPAGCPLISVCAATAHAHALNRCLKMGSQGENISGSIPYQLEILTSDRH